jgi:hypothetical protein
MADMDSDPGVKYTVTYKPGNGTGNTWSQKIKENEAGSINLPNKNVLGNPQGAGEFIG